MNLRQYIRHPSDIPIEYSIPEGASITGQALIDVGIGGLSFSANEALGIGQQLQFCIPSIRPDVHIEAVVSWCEETEKGYQVGVKFLKEHDHFTMRMIEQICHIENYRQQILEREGRKLSSCEAAQEWIRLFAANFPNA